MNQQLDINGNLHDIAPEHEAMRLFDSAPQIRGQIALDTDEDWRAARAAAAPLARGSACVFTYDGRYMSGEVDDVSACGITVYGRESGRRYLVGSQDARRETPQEQDRRERLGYYVEDDPERRGSLDTPSGVCEREAWHSR